RPAPRVTAWLADWWPPHQTAPRLRIEFGGDPMMRVSHETIYRALYVQGRGQLRRELARCLRTGRARRRAGHWEGHLLIGTDLPSAVGTLVERTTRYVVLLHLPDGHAAHLVEQAMR